jgi:hypothetical protein
MVATDEGSLTRVCLPLPISQNQKAILFLAIIIHLPVNIIQIIGGGRMDIIYS